jgi:hypothetical protein
MAEGILAWSHSRIDTFKKCPKMLKDQLDKVVPFEQSEKMKWGDRVHKALEFRVRDHVALTNEFAQYEQIAAAIERAPGNVLCENKITLDVGLKPTGWFAKDAYVRVIVDVMKINKSVGFMGDYKTGNPKYSSEDQLKLFAAAGFQAYQNIDRWTTAYVWTQTGKMDLATYERSELPRLWEELLQAPRRLQEAHVMDHWPAKPGWYCGFCASNKYGKCEFPEVPYRGE